MTLLKLILSRIPEKNNRPPRQTAGRAGTKRKRNGSRAKNFRELVLLKPLRFCPRADGFQCRAAGEQAVGEKVSSPQTPFHFFPNCE